MIYGGRVANTVPLFSGVNNRRYLCMTRAPSYNNGTTGVRRCRLGGIASCSCTSFRNFITKVDCSSKIHRRAISTSPSTIIVRGNRVVNCVMANDFCE